MELSEFAKRLLTLAEDLAGAPVRVDVSYTVTAASGTLVEAVAESPELALAQWLVDVLEDGPRTSYEGAMELGRPQGAPLQAPGGNGHGAKGPTGNRPTGSRPTTPEHLERMRGMTGRRNAEIAEELGLPLSTVSYHMGKIRKEADGQRTEGGGAEEGGPFRAGD